MQTHPLRIAVLECDEPIGRSKEKYGGYGGMFSALLHNGAKMLADEKHPAAAKGKLELEITKFDVVNAEMFPKLEEVDGILISGSKFNSFDNDPWILRLVEFTQKVLAQSRVRLVGVCFGHQIIGRAMGVKVDRSDKGWEVAVTEVELTKRGKEIMGLDKMAIHQMHRDIVYDYPRSVEPLGHTNRCDVQGMYEARRLISVQGHPEFDGDVVSEVVERRHEQGIFDQAMYDEIMTRVRKPHDGVKIAAVFLRFLLEE